METIKKFKNKILVTLSILILCGLGYFIVNQYRIQKLQTQEQKASLQEAQSEIEKLKLANNITQQKQGVLEKGIQNKVKNLPNNQISASELSPYITGIVKIDCPPYSGSGSLQKFNNKNYVLTNFHVIEDSIKDGRQNCLFIQFPKEKGGQSFTGSISLKDRKIWNNVTDVALLPIIDVQSLDNLNLNINSNILNYKFSELPYCSKDVSVGTPVFTLGFPSSGTIDLGYAITSSLIVSNGIVSGHDESSSYPISDLPYSNYFVSARIDSGNSGGIAIAKTGTSLCILGIPTWLNIGHYDTQGIVQNIHNVLYQK